MGPRWVTNWGRPRGHLRLEWALLFSAFSARAYSSYKKPCEPETPDMSAWCPPRKPGVGWGWGHGHQKCVRGPLLMCF